MSIKLVSFEDIGAVVATCQVERNTLGGQVVKMTSNGVVGPCKDGDVFCGLSMEPRGEFAAVQFKGFMTVPYTGSLNPGWVTLVADGNGGVKPADSGVNALVVDVNIDHTVVICL